jgi:hypothetical protein
MVANIVGLIEIIWTLRKIKNSVKVVFISTRHVLGGLRVPYNTMTKESTHSVPLFPLSINIHFSLKSQCS